MLVEELLAITPVEILLAISIAAAVLGLAALRYAEMLKRQAGLPRKKVVWRWPSATRATKAEQLGAIGERNLVARIEEAQLPGEIFSNVYVPKIDGSTSEVDVVFVTQKRIYVFENKNYSGWIFGRSCDKMWTQTLNAKTKNRFYNPIKQNAGHVKALACHLRLSEDWFVPIVVFSDRCDFKSLEMGNEIVIHEHQVASLLAAQEDLNADEMVPGEREGVLHSLASCESAPDSVKQQHVRTIETRWKRPPG